MKIMFCLLFLSLSTLAFALTPEEQENLIKENKMLREELQKSKTEPAPKESIKIMEALQRGKAHQQESNAFLEELDKEE